jgi:hypothetical protein
LRFRFDFFSQIFNEIMFYESVEVSLTLYEEEMTQEVEED